MGCSTCFSIEKNWPSLGEWFENFTWVGRACVNCFTLMIFHSINLYVLFKCFGWMEDWRSLKCGIVEWGFDWLNWKNGMDVERAGGSFSCRVGLGEEGIWFPKVWVWFLKGRTQKWVIFCNSGALRTSQPSVRSSQGGSVTSSLRPTFLRSI